MPLFLENFDLGFLRGSEETFGGFMRHIAQKGKAIVGYYGLPYFNLHYGDVQMILRTARQEDGSGLEVVDMDSHTSGRAVWEVRLSDASINRKDSDLLDRRVVVKHSDASSGMAVVSLVNADVLPSFMEDDLVKMQVVGFPELIQYFPDEDAYAQTQPALRNGSKFLLAEGAVFPSGLMRNRDPDSPEFESNEHLDDIVNIRGTVKALYHGRFEFNGESHDTFIRCIIDTDYGPLEIDHCLAQVDEAQRKNIRVGAIVNFYGTLSGDVAIYEYEKGIVRDEAHDLSALRYVFCGGDAERLRSILAENATYLSEYNNALYEGPDAIITRLKFVQKDHSEKYFAHEATIVSIDEGESAPAYGVGKRCVVLASGEPNRYESIAFIDTDEAGNITRIVTSVNPRYHFTIGEKPVRKTPLDDVEPPKSVVEPMLLRARFHGIIDDSITDEQVLRYADYAEDFEQNIHRMLEAMPQAEGKDKERLLANLYGYLFAKAVEMHYAKSQLAQMFRSGFICNYTPSDVWAGEIRSNLNAEQHIQLEDAFDLGKQFFNDFKFFQAHIDTDNYDENILKSLMLVQNLGCFYSRKCLNW